MTQKEHKAGFVNIIGMPNVGKSTLMNAMVGEKLSIITPKAQTTRHRILGILNGDNFQIIYSDTPGLIKPHYKLHKAMIKYIESALEDADIILLVIDSTNDKVEESFLTSLKNTDKSIVIAINKVDLINDIELELLTKKWNKEFTEAFIIPISALHKANLNILFNKLIELLPFSPPYFPKDELTDKSIRFFVSEIIREKIFLNYHKEVPYCTEVVIERFAENENPIKINATIYVARESQKAIILGKGGKAIKKIGIEARKEIEEMLEKHIYLDLTVKVNKNWRDNLVQLKRLGYDL
ncbi:MAG TPA: GTPase Era [Bacteroidales bacterium]|nr:GTPase Era [Bacteroidales bacterium]